MVGSCAHGNQSSSATSHWLAAFLSSYSPQLLSSSWSCGDQYWILSLRLPCTLGKSPSLFWMAYGSHIYRQFFGGRLQMFLPLVQLSHHHQETSQYNGRGYPEAGNRQDVHRPLRPLLRSINNTRNLLIGSPRH